MTYRVYRDMAEAGLSEPCYKQAEFMLYAELRNNTWGHGEVSWESLPQVTPQAALEEEKLLAFCDTPRDYGVYGADV